MTSLYITEPGAYLNKRGGHVVIGRNNEVLKEVPLEKLEAVHVVDTVSMSSVLIVELLERNIPLTWLSGRGRFYGTLMNPASVDVNKHRKQFELLEEESVYLEVSKKMVAAKVHNQLTILRRYERNVGDEVHIERGIRNIMAIRKHIEGAEDYRALMGYEGIISRVYFETIGAILPEGFTFQKRSKQPPKDPFNSMLGFGYSLLFNEVLSRVVAVGLHPYVGCLHRLAKGHPALVSDLMEEWRAPIVDAMVLAMAKRNVIRPDMFEYANEGCYLDAEARKIFSEQYHRKMNGIQKYFEPSCSYREAVGKQCAAYARVVSAGDAGFYEPLTLR